MGCSLCGRRVFGRKSGFGAAEVVRRLPRRRPDELVEEFDGFAVMSGLFQQRGCGIEVFKWIADHHDQAAQQIERAGRVACGEADFSQAEEVRGNQVVAFDLTRKDEFENLAR